jgi:hypothetical protein
VAVAVESCSFPEAAHCIVQQMACTNLTQTILFGAIGLTFAFGAEEKTLFQWSGGLAPMSHFIYGCFQRLSRGTN